MFWSMVLVTGGLALNCTPRRDGLVDLDASLRDHLKDVVDLEYIPQRRRLVGPRRRRRQIRRPKRKTKKKQPSSGLPCGVMNHSTWGQWRPGTVPSSLCNAVTAEDLQKTVRGRTLTFLGDSQLCEIVEMVMVHLVGDKRVLDLKTNARNDRRTISFYKGRNLTVRGTFEKPKAGRDFTMTVPELKFEVRYRWMGHASTLNRKGGMGLRSMLQVPEKDLKLHGSVDLVILQSDVHNLGLLHNPGLRHDPAKDVSPLAFRNLLVKALDRIIAKKIPPHHIIWTSSNQRYLCNHNDILAQYDAVARDVLRRRNASFVDVMPVLRHFPMPFMAACCSDDLGLHRGSIARLFRPSKSLALSAFETNLLLQEIQRILTPL